MITGLSHLTFVVKDLERATAFFEKIFDAKQIYASGDKPFSLSREKFFLISGLWICIMEGEPPAARTYSHVAFQIEAGEADKYLARIKAVGAELKPDRPRVEGEGHSIYFYDFDNHLFELHVGSLEERLACYAGENSN